MKNNKRKIIAFGTLVLAGSLALSGCGSPGLTSGNAFGLNPEVTVSADADSGANLPSDLPGDAGVGNPAALIIPADAVYAELAGVIGQEWNVADETLIDLNAAPSGTVTITETGTYRISGILADGGIVVDVPGDNLVRLILDNAHITNPTGSALAILDADGGTALVLAAGSVNTLVDGREYADTSDDAPNATLFADDDLVIFGTGSLDITANFNDGINFNDGLVIDQATITIEAVDDGISGNEFLAILGGSITITESEEGLEAEQVFISGGVIDITSTDDGVNASGDEGADLLIMVSGGDVTITADGDGIDSNGAFVQTGGNIIVHGPTGRGDGALDADLGITLDGGTMFAVGSAGMLVTPQSSSAQGWLVTPLSATVPAGTTLAIMDDAGATVATLITTREVAAVTFSDASIVNGATYTVVADGVEVGSVVAGQAAGGRRGPGANPGNGQFDPNQMPNPGSDRRPGRR